MSSSQLPPLSLTCEVKFPSKDDNLHDHVVRWSDIHVSVPAVVVIPESESDVVAAIVYAKDNSLRVVVAGGGHAPFIPVTAKTLYLDLRRFKSIVLDEGASTVTIGGGVLTGELLTYLLERGFYATLPNSSAVGVVGAVLGVGNGPFNSLHGFMADNVESVRIVTLPKEGAAASRNISHSSTGADERSLFAAVCGAGHGLGVIVSMTLRAYKVADLRLEGGDQVWNRRGVFPAPAIRDAARAFVSLLPLTGPANATLLIARSPPNMPRPGSPIALLVAAHFGPSAEAEASPAAKILLGEDFAAKAAVAVTEGVPLAKLNASTEPFNAVGGSKILSGTYLHSINEDVIVSLFERFVGFTNERPDLWNTYIAIPTWNTTKSLQLGASPERKDNFHVARDRNVLVLSAVWSKTGGADIESESSTYSAEIQEIAGREESGPLIGFANNLAFPAKLADYYPADKVDELARVKTQWDPNGLFWSPSMGVE
ncbi:uncharacterized protein SPSK_06269 [Sporothrix schenckii 1099-18]|uniref:FAD-binding PCMH-type domain-containing protein n=2 Tax=Sporothrix schenckii TaxID=29908 RepID=U7PI91_SPOS1|nr:uncharacterized protein SPSK_06269 [Sporothrix schenckii 1099-18]ERS95257.1 hypothetical protein HMPREF1624_08469 [Sporothrix schenckii ATCC 58251]KJR90063.1 hypothetical protein SPSK_06269 [Sporothrix schenckii 1099-18]